MPKISMTPQKLKSLKAIEGKRTEYQDNKTEGLGLRVTPTGAKSWFMLYYRQSDKKKRRVTLGKYPALGLADARTKAREFLTAIEQGQDPAGEKQARKEADTFAELTGFYIERYAKKNKRTWKENQRMIDHDLLPDLGKMKADQITKKDIIRILDSIADRGAGYLSNHVLALIRKIYNWALEEDLQTFNPALGIRKRHKEEARTRFLSVDEIKQFWEALESTNATQPLKRIMRLALLTGQRVGEVSGAMHQEIDLQAKVWQLPKDRTKNKLPHALPLAPMALEMFTQAIEDAQGSPFIFPSPTARQNKGILPTAAARVLNRHKDIIGLDDFRAHDLRRTVINHMLGDVLNIEDGHVSYVMNHSSYKSKSVTLMVYDQNKYNPKKRAALELWESYLASILAGEGFNVVPFRGRDVG